MSKTYVLLSLAIICRQRPGLASFPLEGDSSWQDSFQSSAYFSHISESVPCRRLGSRPNNSTLDVEQAEREVGNDPERVHLENHEGVQSIRVPSNFEFVVQ